MACDSNFGQKAASISTYYSNQTLLHFASSVSSGSLVDILPALKCGDSQASQLRFLFLSLSGISQLPFGRAPIRSYVRSTDFHRWCFAHREHRKPCGENILCGIDISVVMCLALRTIPLPNIKRQFINNVTALSTALAARKPSVNLNQRPTIPLALIFQLTHQLSPACISNCLCQLMVLQHILHRQIFDSNRLVFTYQSSCQLVLAKRTQRSE